MQHQPLSLRETSACIVAAGAAIIVIGVMPILAGLFVDQFNLTLDQVGWVLSTESIGIGIGTALAYFLSPRGHWRKTTFCAAVLAAAANLLTAIAPDVWSLVLLRLCSGIGAGAAYSVVIYLLGRAKDTSRAFAGVVLTQSVLFAAYAKWLPELKIEHGYGLAVASIAMWFILVAGLSIALPKHSSVGPASIEWESTSEVTAGRSDARGLLALLGLLTFLIGVFAFWAFAERLGAERGLSDTQVASGISLGLAVGILAALFALLVGDRPGRALMSCVASISVLAGLFTAAASASATGYNVALVLFNIGWALGVAYFMSLTVHHDPAQVFSRLIPGAQVLSGVLGPAIVALFIRDHAVTAVVVAAGFACVALLLGVTIGYSRRSSSHLPSAARFEPGS